MNKRRLTFLLLMCGSLSTGCAVQAPASQPGMLSFADLAATISVTREADETVDTAVVRDLEPADIVLSAR